MFKAERVLRLLALVLVGLLVGTVGHGWGVNSPDSWLLPLGWGTRAVQASPGEEWVRPVDSPAAQFPDQLIDQPAETLAPRPGRRPTQPVTVPTPRERRGNLPSPVPPQTPAPGLNDPAQQVAPAVIELSPGNRPLSLVVSLAMRQELQNLIGRFESAELLSRSLDLPTTLAVGEPGSVLTAATDAVALGEEPTDLHPALVEAQQLLEAWDGLLDAEDYAVLKERWLAVRQDLWQNFPTQRPFAQAEIRAVWLDRGTIVEAGSPQGLSQVFDRLAAAGINTVFFETVNAGYPIYPSRIAPQQNPLTRRWDPLAAAVNLAHARGMTLHAWVWVFAAGNQRHNRLLNLPTDYPGPILAQHPDWAGYDNLGNTIPPGQDKPFLDPANPEVRSYLTRLMSEIVTSYAVDGLHLDYIRYPFQNPAAHRTYGYGEVARWQFNNITGVDPLDLAQRSEGNDPRNQQIQQQVLWNRWTEFRTQQVTSFVATLSATLRRQRPDLILSAAVFASPEAERLQSIQQDWGTWARADYLDWIVLMSYAQDTSRFEQLIQPWLGDESFGSTLIIPGIRLLNLSGEASFDQLQTTRDLPAPGYALFAAADFTSDFSAVLGRTQGATEPVPLTPEQIALNRYQALQREWYWLLSQQKLWMDRDTLTRWVEAANQLEADLQALVENPSRRHLAAARASLALVQAPLTTNISIGVANRNYRLQSWQHRLATIGQLLDYGDRRAQLTQAP